VTGATHSRAADHRVVPLRTRWAYAVGMLVLVAQTLYLALSLPAHETASHYRLAWVGLDVILLAEFFLVLYCSWREQPARAAHHAYACAVLLVAVSKT
jgi:hypothetical protein